MVDSPAIRWYSGRRRVATSEMDMLEPTGGL